MTKTHNETLPFLEDPSIAILAIDILQRVLTASNDLDNLAEALCSAIRELTGAKVTFLVSCHNAADKEEYRHEILGCSPDRRRSWCSNEWNFKFLNATHQFETKKPLTYNTDFSHLPAPAADFGLCLIMPLNTPRSRSGEIVALGVPSKRRLDATVLSLQSILQTIAIVVENALYTHEQDQILKSRNAELQKSEALFRGIFQNAATGIAILSQQANSFVLEKLNEQAEQMWQLSASKTIGRPFQRFYQHDDKTILLKTITNVAEIGQTELIPEQKHVQDKQTRWLEYRVFQLPSQQIAIMAEDCTERHVMGERMRQTEKLDAIGQLAGGIAHDFNNQLAAVMGYVEMIGLKSDSEKLKRYANRALVGTRRAQELTKQLLAFARKSEYENRPLSIHQVIDEVVSMLEHTIDRRIEIHQHLNASQDTITGDPPQLQNAILNLAINARDAMPEGGTLSITTEDQSLKRTFCKQLPFEIDPGDYIVVSISDTGTGMDEDVLENLFDPFFTTKTPDKGTGMGLATVYSAVKHHAGAINVYSELDQGTTFKIYLPLQTDQADVNSDATPFPATTHQNANKHTGTVMVVDDEALFRDYIYETLTEIGFDVIVVENGNKAVDIYQKEKDRIDIVLLDMLMPECDGKETFGKLKQIAPDVTVLLASGYCLNGEAQTLLEKGAAGFIQKPFQQNDVIQKIQDLIHPQT